MFWCSLVGWVAPDTFTRYSWQAAWNLNVQLIVDAIKCSFFLLGLGEVIPSWAYNVFGVNAPFRVYVKDLT